MKKTRVISAIFLAVFLCLSVSAVYAQNDQYETHAQINSVSLNGQGDYLKIEPGGSIEVEVFYEFWYPYPLPKDINEIVIGFEGTPGICLIDGILDNITGLTGVFDYGETFGMIAPTEPGIYHLMRVRTKGYTCQDARELYRDYPSTRKIIGTIEVIGSESDERDQGAIEVTHVSLDFVGLEDWFDVEPGELLEARVCYDYLYPWHLQKHEYRVVVGYEDTAIFCIDEEIRREYPGNTGDGSDCTIFTIKAPMEPGIYSIYKTYTKGLTCSEAKEHYENNPDAREIIDHFEVKADVPDEPDKPDDNCDKWDPIFVKVTDLQTKSGYQFFYTIVIFQRGSELRMNISTADPDVDRNLLLSGSVSISVEEDIYIDYYSGKVSSRKTKVAEIPGHGLEEIKPDPVRILAQKTVLALAGLIPGIGQSLNVIGYYNEVMVDKNAVEVYVEENRAEYQSRKPRYYFEDKFIENERDIVVIPWYLDSQKCAIVIDCPNMTVSKERTRDVVFRVDCFVALSKIRHDIALSIDFPENWHTDDGAEVKPW